MNHIAFIGIGSNLGDKVGNCKSAIGRLGRVGENRILRQSSFYKTDPVGYRAQDWFINCVVKVETALKAHDLLACLKMIERVLGRWKTFPWGPRLIDLDLLFFDRQRLNSGDLQIPHPRLHERAFVLVPLCEIAPDMIHPGLGKTARRLLRELGEVTGVEKI
jgi:2-amino-4-hydroxy-6-hydroxymethyldihydropteridine diphosphokinase